MSAVSTLITWTFAVVCVVTLGFVTDDYPFRNISLDWDTRVDDLVSRLTLQVSKILCYAVSLLKSVTSWCLYTWLGYTRPGLGFVLRFSLRLDMCITPIFSIFTVVSGCTLNFYSAGNARIARAVLATAIPSVCLSRRHCVKTTARSTVQFALSDSKMCLVL